jgi:hypothetical protein
MLFRQLPHWKVPLKPLQITNYTSRKHMKLNVRIQKSPLVLQNKFRKFDKCRHSAHTGIVLQNPAEQFKHTFRGPRLLGNLFLHPKHLKPPSQCSLTHTPLPIGSLTKSLGLSSFPLSLTYACKATQLLPKRSTAQRKEQ